MDFSRFTTISFDCSGTLIDWEGGILPALRAVLKRCAHPKARAKSKIHAYVAIGSGRIFFWMATVTSWALL
jgi:phosphoglycolate phosphatase-like HAD superfamily hydrolase